jgi:hypothetical protein
MKILHHYWPLISTTPINLSLYDITGVSHDLIGNTIRDVLMDEVERIISFDNDGMAVSEHIHHDLGRMV